MAQEGSHTWELVWHYHLCPKCKRIFESRTGYHYDKGSYTLALTCPHCKHPFIDSKKSDHPSSLLGRREPIEWDWPEER